MKFLGHRHDNMNYFNIGVAVVSKTCKTSGILKMGRGRLFSAARPAASRAFALTNGERS